jgi:hypothetical protein
MFRNPRIHLQEDCYMYRYGIVYFTCITIRSLVDGRMCSILMSRNFLDLKN